MFRQSEADISQKTLVTRFYEAAKSRSIDAVKVVLAEGGINVRDTKDETAFEKLIAEGDLESISFLSRNFNISDDAIMRGLGRQADIQKINQVLKKSTNRKSRLNFLATAIYALYAANHSDTAESYLMGFVSGVDAENEFVELQMAKIAGLIQADKMDEAFSIFKTEEDEKSKYQYMKAIVHASGLFGKTEVVTRLIDDEGLDEEYRFALLKLGLTALAQGNHLDEINSLIVHYPLPHNELLLAIAEGFSKSGAAYLIEQAWPTVPKKDRIPLIETIITHTVNSEYYAEAISILSLVDDPDELAIALAFLTKNLLFRARFTDAHNLLLLSYDRKLCMRGN